MYLQASEADHSELKKDWWKWGKGNEQPPVPQVPFQPLNSQVWTREQTEAQRTFDRVPKFLEQTGRYLWGPGRVIRRESKFWVRSRKKQQPRRGPTGPYCEVTSPRCVGTKMLDLERKVEKKGIEPTQGTQGFLFMSLRKEKGEGTLYHHGSPDIPTVG